MASDLGKQTSGSSKSVLYRCDPAFHGNNLRGLLQGLGAGHRDLCLTSTQNEPSMPQIFVQSGSKLLVP